MNQWVMEKWKAKKMRFFHLVLNANVREYLEQHLKKQLITRPGYIQQSGAQRGRRKQQVATGANRRHTELDIATL